MTAKIHAALVEASTKWAFITKEAARLAALAAHEFDPEVVVPLCGVANATALAAAALFSAAKSVSLGTGTGISETCFAMSMAETLCASSDLFRRAASAADPTAGKEADVALKEAMALTVKARLLVGPAQDVGSVLPEQR